MVFETADGGWHEVAYVLLLNTILASCCSLFSGFGLWIFKGLFHNWIFSEDKYLWTTHWLYAVFNVGCIGLFTVNLLALATWTETTGDEAYRTVFIVNVVMHGIWGMHNLHMTVRRFRGTDDGTLGVMRRPYPLMGWSAVGSCGSATIRNLYCAVTPLDELSMGVIVFTWVWEWIGFVYILFDFAWFMVKENKCGSHVMSDTEAKLNQTLSADSPDAADSPVSTENAG